MGKLKVIKEAIIAAKALDVTLVSGEKKRYEPYAVVDTELEEGKLIIYCTEEDFFKPVSLDDIEEIGLSGYSFVPDFKAYNDFKKWCRKNKVIHKVKFEIAKVISYQ